MIAVDSSVAIAGFASWHDHHAAAVKVLAREPQLIAHAAIETYSVLTRLPPPHRAPADLVESYLDARFPTELLGLPDPHYRSLINKLASKQILGGQVYDALIAYTAVVHGVTLVSFDQRATLIYEAMGAQIAQPD